MSRSEIVVLGSKSIGVQIARQVLAATGACRLLTFDDRADSRSALDELIDLGAEVVSEPKFAGLMFGDARVVIVGGWYWLLPEASLEHRKVIGFHNSLLPRYRGGSPLVWAMIRGEPEVGVSMFEIGPGMDDGPLWGQASTPIGPDEMVGDVLHRLESASIALLARHLPFVLAGVDAPTRQDESAATYCAQRVPADGRIDWSWPAGQVHDFVRAQSRPYPGAFSELGDTRVAIWRTQVSDRVYIGNPGQIVNGSVICGDDRMVDLVDVDGHVPRHGRFTRA